MLRKDFIFDRFRWQLRQRPRPCCSSSATPDAALLRLRETSGTRIDAVVEIFDEADLALPASPGHGSFR
ncbi:MAG: hypothetical protein ACLSHC_10465 [Bilophila wadsworthia]